MYDFDTVIDRSGTGSCKWDRRNAYEVQNGLIPMSIADMEFAVAPCVKDAVVKAAMHGIYGYTDPSPRFYKAVGSWMKKRHNLDVDDGDIVTLSGVVPALRIAVRSLSDPGDGVIIQSPVYPPFKKSVTDNGRRAEDCPLKEVGGRYEMDFEALEEAAKKPDVKLMLLCSPHNPVGRVWTVDELSRLADICRENGVTVVSDEIHSDIILKGKHTNFLNVNGWTRDNSVVFTAPSKTFNIPGLNTAIGIVKSGALREKIDMQAETDGFENMSYFGHAATIAAYEGAAEWLDSAIDYIRGNISLTREFCEKHMPELKVADTEGTYLAWVDFRALGYTDGQLEDFTRNKARLFLDEGYIFGKEGSGFERINAAMPRKEYQKALDRLYKAYLER